MSQRRGFTFVELMLVLGIIAVMSAIAIPRYSRSLSRYRLELAAQRIAADLNFARSRANASSASVTVNFQVNPVNRIDIPTVTGLKTAFTTWQTLLGEEPYRAAITAASFSGSPTVTYNGYGTPSVGGSVTVQVAGLSKTILVNAVTGEAAVQ